jgi:hypothetical protein
MIAKNKYTMQLDSLIRPRAFSSPLHQQYFATIGKALYIAQHFEMTCKSLVSLLGHKNSVIMGSISLDDAGLKEFCQKIEKRRLHSAIEDLVSLASLPSDLKDMLTTAKESRNNIAHDSTISMNDPLAPEEALWESLESLSKDVDKLCIADAAVCSMIYSLTEDEVLHVNKGYTRDVMLWVFSDFEGEEFMDNWKNK